MVLVQKVMSFSRSGGGSSEDHAPPISALMCFQVKGVGGARLVYTRLAYAYGPSAPLVLTTSATRVLCECWNTNSLRFYRTSQLSSHTVVDKLCGCVSRVCRSSKLTRSSLQS